MKKRIRITRRRTTLAACCVQLAGISMLTMVAPLWALGDESVVQGPTIEPEPEVQAEIRRAMDTSSMEELHEQLDKLRKVGGKNFKKLIPQLLYYSMHATDSQGRHGMEQAMTFFILTDHLRIQKSTVAHSLVPYLGTQDPALKKKLRRVLGSYEDASADRPPKFHVYGSIVEHSFRKSEEPPYDLVQYMYQIHPGMALLTMTRASQLKDLDSKRQILWAEHEIADVLWKHKHEFIEPDQVEPSVKEELEKLARSEHWWARLYVAEIMRQHRGFRQAERVERLKQDKHPLVRKTIMAFVKKTD